MTSRLKLALLAGSMCGLIACNSAATFDASQIAAIAERAPVTISSAVRLTADQIACAVRANLWEPAYADSPGNLRLTPAGKDIGFQGNLDAGVGPVTHDAARLRTGDAALQNAADIGPKDSVQAGVKTPIAGNLNLRVGEIQSVAEGTKAGTKTVRASLSVQLEHACFVTPLPIESGGLEFVLINNEWHLAQVLR